MAHKAGNQSCPRAGQQEAADTVFRRLSHHSPSEDINHRSPSRLLSTEHAGHFARPRSPLINPTLLLHKVRPVTPSTAALQYLPSLLRPLGARCLSRKHHCLPSLAMKTLIGMGGAHGLLGLGTDVRHTSGILCAPSRKGPYNWRARASRFLDHGPVLQSGEAHGPLRKKPKMF